MAAIFAVTCATCSWIQSSAAAGILLGPFCIEGVELIRVEDEETVTADGKWAPIRMEFDETSEASASIAIFDKELPKFSGLPTCKEAVAEANKKGISLVAAGPLRLLRISGQLFISNSASENRIQIAEGALTVELKSVAAGTKAIDGGNINFKGGPLRITNPRVVRTGSPGTIGLLEIFAPGRTVSAMRIAMPGGAAFVTNLVPAKDAKPAPTIRIDLSDSHAQLWAGDFVGANISAITGDAAVIGELSLLKPNVKVGSLSLKVAKGLAKASVGKLSGQSDRLVWKRRAASVGLSQPTVQIDTLTGAGKSGKGAFELQPERLANVAVTSQNALLEKVPGGSVLAGSLKANFVTLAPDNVQGQLLWTKPTIAPLEFALTKGAVTDAKMMIKGDARLLSLDTELKATQLDLRKVALKENFSLNFKYTDDVAAVIKIPIKIEVPQSSGKFTIADENQVAIVTGGVRRSSLEADIYLDLAKLEQSRIEIAPSKLNIGLFAAVASRPLVAGVVPSFADAELRLSNPLLVVLSKEPKGYLDLAAQTMVLGQPIIKIGSKGTTARSTLKLSSVAEALLRYDLATGRLPLVKGAFEARNAEFKLLDPGAKINLADMDVVDPIIKLELLAITYDATADIVVGTAALSKFSATGSRIQKERDPAKPNEVVFSARIEQPLAIQSLSAAHVDIKDVLTLDVISIEQFMFGLSDARVELGKGAAVRNASLSLSGDGIASARVSGGEIQVFRNVSLRTSGNYDPGSAVNINGGAQFSVAVTVNGPSAALDGAGRAGIDALTGSQQAEVKVAFKCKGGPGLTVPLEYNFAVGGVELAAQFNKGQFTANAEIGPLALLVHSKSGDECDSERKHHTVIGKGWTWGICTQAWPPKAWRCRWETPEVGFDYHIHLAIRFAGGLIVLTRPMIQIGEGKLRVCNLGIVDTSKLVLAGGYSPQIDTPFGGDGEKIVNAIIAAHFEAFQSIVATTLLSGVGWLIGNVTTVYGNASCLF